MPTVDITQQATVVEATSTPIVVDFSSTEVVVEVSNPTLVLEAVTPFQAFPVGSTYLAVVSTNPGTLLGYGTWAFIGVGEILTGLDSCYMWKRMA